MANYNLTDLAATVSISKNEYEELVRDSEQLKIVKKFIKESKYAGSNDVAILLNIGEEKGEE